MDALIQVCLFFFCNYFRDIGAHIGPEPTTDKWVAVMKSEGDDLVIPGNAAAVQADKPFNGLARFGSSFLSKFQVETFL